MRSFAALLLVCLLTCASVLAQQPANALPVSWLPTESFGPADTQATPDTTTPWHYFPLHVGNVWEYVDYEGDVVVQYRIAADTVFSGHPYVRLSEERHPRRPDGSWGIPTIYSSLLRYDSTQYRVLENSPFAEYERVYYYTRCALNVSFDSIVDCTPEGSWAVGGGYNGVLVFGGERAGEGADTLRTPVKTFVQLGTGVEYGLAAGIGLVYHAVEGYRWALHYAKVNGVAYGRPFIPVASEQEAVPDAALRIVRIWPQPVRDRATLRVALPEAARVTVEVFDLVGRRVAVLLDGPQAAGAHEVTVNTRALTSGMYLVRLTSGSQVRTQRLHVVR